MRETERTADGLIPGVDYEVATCPLCGSSSSHDHPWEEWGFPDLPDDDDPEDTL